MALKLTGEKKWLKLGTATFLSVGMLAAYGDGEDHDGTEGRLEKMLSARLTKGLNGIIAIQSFLVIRILIFK